MADNFSKSDNNYGLPEVDLVPIDRDQPGIAKPFVPPVAPPVTKTEKDNKWVPILLLIAIGLIVASAVFYFFFMDTSTSDTLADNTEEVTDPDRVTLEETDQLNSSSDNADSPEAGTVDSNTTSENQAVDETVETQEPGTIRTISDRTGRYYIFLGSYKFKAYAERHADKLASDGFAVKIITPDNWVGMRVAVGNYGSEAEAADDVNRIQAKYGNQVVVSKY